MLTGGAAGTMRTADKLDSVESVDAARLQHWETAENHSAVDTGCSRRIIPRAIRCTQLLIMGVVEHTVVWHKQCIALERTNCTRCNRTIPKSFANVIHCSPTRSYLASMWNLLFLHHVHSAHLVSWVFNSMLTHTHTHIHHFTFTEKMCRSPITSQLSASTSLKK